MAADEDLQICKAGSLTRMDDQIRDESAKQESQQRLGLLLGQCSVPDDFDQIEGEAITKLFEEN